MQDYNNTQNLDIRGDAKQKTENEPDWTEGSSETTETFPLDGLGWEEDFDMGPGCLTTTTTKVPMKNLRSYTIQNKPLFPVNAVRFRTIKGNTICSDPSSPWAIKAMNTARQSVTATPEKMSSINTKSAQSSKTRVSSTPVKKQVYTQNLTDRGDTTPTETGNETELHIPVTTLEQDWRGSTETTETFQLDGLAQEEEESTIMNEFRTIKGNTICSDPSSPWAIKAMKYLDAKKKPQPARKSVTAAPVNTPTTNMTRSSAQIDTQTFG
ncbi:unnamed protein product [Leuciscus chuanchicus]